MNSYYSDTLSAKKLEKCYEIAQPRIVQYMSAEIEFVMRTLESTDRVLELGCGYLSSGKRDWIGLDFKQKIDYWEILIGTRQREEPLCARMALLRQHCQRMTSSGLHKS